MSRKSKAKPKESADELVARIAAAIENAVAEADHRHQDKADYIGNRSAFWLAHCLKAIEHFPPEIDEKTITPYAKRFYRLAAEVNQELLNDEYGDVMPVELFICQVLEVWPKVKVGYQQSLQVAIERAEAVPMPPELESLPPDAQRLGKVCRELALMNNREGWFFLSQIDASDKVFTRKRKTGRYWLIFLEQKGIIARHKAGGFRKGASEYVYNFGSK